MITERVFGKMPNGESVILYSITNDNGMQADIINYGAILVNLYVPDKCGELADVVCGYDELEKYFSNPFFLGACIGPIANRTAKAAFQIDGKEYHLQINDGENNLHSHSSEGFHKKLWRAEPDGEHNRVVLALSMADGELGFPGNRDFFVTYSLSEQNELKIEYSGKSDKKTLFNPTNHSYFNLKGHDAGSILDETLWLNCFQFTEIIEGAVPTGILSDVKDTPLDFTTEMPIGAGIRRHFPQMNLVGGYDHNFVINAEQGKMTKAAVLSDRKAGRCMEVYTDMPGIQVYSGNCIGRHIGKGGAVYRKRCAIALETQFFPNSANEPNFTRPLLEPDKIFHSETIYKFL